MTELPKILEERLRAAARAPGAHPEADALAAFAEQALAAAERESVLAHLGLCQECREVVALASPASEPVTIPVSDQAAFEPERVSVPIKRRDDRPGMWGLRWASLRWAALAAGIVVAVWLVRPAFEHNAQPTANVGRVSGASTAKAVQPNSEPPATASVQLSTRLESRKTDMLTGIPANKPTQPGENSSISASRMENAAPAAPSASSAGGSSEGSLIARRKDEKQLKKGGGEAGVALVWGLKPNGANVAGVPKTVAEQPAEADSTMRNEAPAASLPSGETVQVSAEAAVIEVAPPRDAGGAAGLERVEKAKPALDKSSADEDPKASKNATVVTQSAALGLASNYARAAAAQAVPPAASKPDVTWIITEGELQRSVDGGQSWQTSARTDYALLCFAPRGQEIWAGGQAGTLLHSTDSGTTWSTVRVAMGNQTLKSDVTRIDVSATGQVVVSTAAHETWKSADGGKTWEKKQ